MAAFPHGNYQGYYPRRRAQNLLPPNQDERLIYLTTHPAFRSEDQAEVSSSSGTRDDDGSNSFFKGKRVLDVGCNVGNVSVEIAQRHGAKQVIGVDIDPTLIQKCRRTVEDVWSCQSPIPFDSLPMQGSVDRSLNSSGDTDLPNKRRKLENGSSTSSLVSHPTSSALSVPNGTSRNNEEGTQLELDYFPTCFPIIHGPLPIEASKLISTSTSSIPSASMSGLQPPTTTEMAIDSSGNAPKTKTKAKRKGNPSASTVEDSSSVIQDNNQERKEEIKPFPQNMVFYVADWAKEMIETDKKRGIVDTVNEIHGEGGYDIVLALSISKWIHLHSLDSGLISFFQKCHDQLNKGGMFVLEPQGWAGYKAAKRGEEKLKQNYSQLTLRPELDFPRILLEQIGFIKRIQVKSANQEDGKEDEVDLEDSASMDGRGAMGLRKLRGNLKVEGANKGFDRDLDVYLKA